MKPTMRRDGMTRFTFRPRFDLNLWQLTAIVALARNEDDDDRPLTKSRLAEMVTNELQIHGPDRMDYATSDHHITDDEMKAAEKAVRALFPGTTWSKRGDQ
jgi:hypothetical protein